MLFPGPLRRQITPVYTDQVEEPTSQKKRHQNKTEEGSLNAEDDAEGLSNWELDVELLISRLAITLQACRS